MKKILILPVLGLAAVLLFTGCIGLSGGTHTTTVKQCPTIGQQLIDLQKAKESGAITDSEYQAEKAKILNSK